MKKTYLRKASLLLLALSATCLLACGNDADISTSVSDPSGHASSADADYVSKTATGDAMLSEKMNSVNTSDDDKNIAGEGESIESLDEVIDAEMPKESTMERTDLAPNTDDMAFKTESQLSEEEYKAQFDDYLVGYWQKYDGNTKVNSRVTSFVICSDHTCRIDGTDFTWDYTTCKFITGAKNGVDITASLNEEDTPYYNIMCSIYTGEDILTLVDLTTGTVAEYVRYK